jgi:valyl-tRNA synthetase
VEGPSPLALEAASAVLAEIRRAKTAARVSLRAPVGRVGVADRPERLAALAEVTGDLCRAGRIADLSVGPAADALAVRVELAGV